MRRSELLLTAVIGLVLLASCGTLQPRAESVPAKPRIETRTSHDACTDFRPVYLTEPEVSALSTQTLTSIINNDNAGRRACGWEKNDGRTGK